MHKDFKIWSDKKETIHSRERQTPYFSDGEIWWCSFGINIGVEIDGKHEEFLRPAIILRKFNKDMILVVPITGKSKIGKYYFDVQSVQGKNYKTCISQIRTISSKRLFRKITEVDIKNKKFLSEKVIKMIQGSM
jgi:mRNA interferase MazF